MTTQPLLPFVPARARRSDPQTSHAAAERLNSGPILSELQREVYAYLFCRQDGATDEEIENALDPEGKRFAPSTIRKRRSDLKEFGLIEAAGERENRRGIKMSVWVVKTAKVK